MELKVEITDEAGNVRKFVISKSVPGEEKTLNDFILEALAISEEKRKLPLKVFCPNGEETYPRICMKFVNFGSSILGDNLEAMFIDWR